MSGHYHSTSVVIYANVRKLDDATWHGAGAGAHARNHTTYTAFRYNPSRFTSFHTIHS